MITGELKNRIDGLWQIFWTGGLTNPLDVIEQITYLMFIRDLDEMDNLRMRESSMLEIPYQSIFEGEFEAAGRKYDKSDFRWTVFRDMNSQEMFDTVRSGVFEYIKGIHTNKDSAYSKYMGDAIFKIPTAQKMAQIVESLDEVYELMGRGDSMDIRGDVYEYLLSKLSTSGTNGQFRTPRHIIRMMVELMEPTVEDRICDPSCGTAGFLVSAGDYVKERNEEAAAKDSKADFFLNDAKKRHYNTTMFTGYDMDRTMLRIGAMNMMTHGVEDPHIEYRDSLSDKNEDVEDYTLILANPPFKGSLDVNSIAPSLQEKGQIKKTELLFVLLFERMLKIGGRCASIVPDGVLFGSSKGHKAVRKMLIEDNRLEAVISMPSGVFKPYAGVSTAIIIFTKTGHGGTDDVWFYDMQADGYSLDDKRSPIGQNDIPDIVSRFKNRDNEDNPRTEKSFLVPKDEIVANDYDLSINKYRKTEYVQEEYPPSKEIVEEMISLNKELGEELEKLRKMLERGRAHGSEGSGFNRPGGERLLRRSHQIQIYRDVR